jgi:hypothetical protein
MVKSNFYRRLYTKENCKKNCLCAGVLAKIDQRSIEQTIKAIDFSMLIRKSLTDSETAETNLTSIYKSSLWKKCVSGKNVFRRSLTGPKCKLD